MVELLPGQKSQGQKVAETINRKRFMRKRLPPSAIEDAGSVFQTAIGHGQSIPFMLLWGIGTKQCVGRAEEAAIHQLGLLNKAVKEIWPAGIFFHIVLADLHAKVNMVPDFLAAPYMHSVKTFFRKNREINNQTELLSRLWAKNGKTLEEVKSTWADYTWLKDDPSFQFIMKNARRRFHGENTLQGALEYIAFRVEDKRLLTEGYQRNAHLTYNNPKIYSFIRPALPTFYSWSLRKGDCRSPWFLADGEI